MSTIDELTARLAEVQRELDSLPPGPSPERYQLLMEQDALRAEAHLVTPDPLSERSTAELEAELSALKRRRNALASSRSRYVMSKGGSNSGPASAAWVKLGQSARSASGVDQLTVRITQIEDELASRRDS